MAAQGTSPFKVTKCRALCLEEAPSAGFPVVSPAWFRSGGGLGVTCPEEVRSWRNEDILDKFLDEELCCSLVPESEIKPRGLWRLAEARMGTDAK